eukprot:SM000040S14833  [mRNA]  locus=s40:675307:678377:- [translate_table: standard]
MDAVRQAVRETPQRLRQRAFFRKSVAEELTADRLESRGEMRKDLNGFDALLFGMGGIIGAVAELLEAARAVQPRSPELRLVLVEIAMRSCSLIITAAAVHWFLLHAGVFVVTGVAAKLHAGPAVAIAYLVSALSALLSAFCYTEFAVEMPVAGGAFSYLYVTFGEGVAFLGASNILMEYLLSSAVVARGFTSYFASLCGQHSDAFRIHTSLAELDPIAVALVAVLSVMLCYGTKDSSWFNMVVTALNLLVVFFIIVAGFVEGNSKNVTRNFTPYGSRGIFDAAALIFFSFIGFDSVATLAEEVKKPSRDLPVGIIGSVVIVAGIYVLMTLALCMMVPYNLIDINAPFSTAFNEVAGWKWARYVVAFGAITGLITSLLVSLIGQARVTCVLGRSHLIPKFLASVHEARGTPINATILLGILTSMIAFFTSLDVLANMVSIGTLFIFLLVAAAMLFKRRFAPGDNPKWLLVHLAAITAASLGVSISYQLSDSFIGPAVFGTLWAASTLSMQVFIAPLPAPTSFAVPLMPWLPSFSILLNTFLLSTLDVHSYIRFATWTGLTVLLYVCYGVHATFGAHGGLPQGAMGTMLREEIPKGAGLNYVRMEQLPAEPIERSTSLSRESILLSPL